MVWKASIYLCFFVIRCLRNPFRYIYIARKLLEKYDQLFSLPSSIKTTPLLLNRVKVEKIETSQSSPDKVILYLHGGAFVIGLNNLYRKFAGSLCNQMKATVFLVDYPLSPEHPFPYALNSCLKVYKNLLQQSISSEKIILMGDSAGGNLCLSLLLKLKQEKIPLPKIACLFSGWFDLTFEPPPYPDNKSIDPIISQQHLPLAVKNYLAKRMSLESHFLVSPLKGDLTHLPPLFLYVGIKEILKEMTVSFAKKAQKAGNKIELFVGEGMVHVHPILFPKDSRSQEVVQEMIQFIDSEIDDQ